MGEVVEFPKQEQMVELLSCLGCENPSFYIHTNGIIECENCNHIIGTVDEVLDHILKLQKT